MLKSLSVLAFILAAAVSHQAGSAKAAPATVHPQTKASTVTYHSGALHFDYTYGSAFQAMTTSETDAALSAAKGESTGEVKQALNCISVPLTATEAPGGQRVIIILRKDGKCIGTTTQPSELGANAASMLSKSLEKFGTPEMGASADYQVAGRNASAVSGLVNSAQLGFTLYGTGSCLLQGSDTICWEFLASDCAKLPEMMKYPVAFEGKDAEAVIPAKFAQVCK